ncbi:MSP domain-containing protein [Aphelenchoides fujianensis]|nr:MSP domain-containing protein [Aphelenchoides fujianensis]
MALNIEPTSASFPAAGGTAKHEVVKSSNNEHYRVKPVYGFVPPKGRTAVELIRLPGPPKEDKLVVQWAEVPAEEEDPQAPFKAGAQAGEVILPLKAE